MAERTEMTVRICRQRGPSAECSEIGCRNKATGKCSVHLRGRKEGQTCGRQLCKACGGKEMVCPPHQRQRAAEAARPDRR